MMNPLPMQPIGESFVFGRRGRMFSSMFKIELKNDQDRMQKCKRKCILILEFLGGGMTTNVRIKPQTYAKLRQLAKRAGVTMPEVLDDAIDELFRKRFIEDCNQAYARLRSNPKAWKEELEERRAWDVTLADGLEDM
jgi:hypothetical protein